MTIGHYMNKSTKQKERKVILKMATSKQTAKKTEPPVQTCRHQWMTVPGDDPYHNKVICIKCGAEKKGGDD